MIANLHGLQASWHIEDTPAGVSLEVARIETHGYCGGDHATLAFTILLDPEQLDALEAAIQAHHARERMGTEAHDEMEF